MEVHFVTAATATDFEDPADAGTHLPRRYAASPHLGVLSLSAVLEQRGYSPRIVELNRLYYEYLAGGFCGVDGFAEWAAGEIVRTRADIYGFGSICSSYPLTIRIAERVKRARPASTILLGGPQASVVDLPTLGAFPFIDFVLRGEAEESLPLFLEQFTGGRKYSAVPGLTWRSAFGPARAPAASVIQDLDALPLPAYHLSGGMEGITAAPLEVGRGCPFSCNFCSTNDFFRRKFRLKSPQRMLEDMRAVAARYGLRRFEFTHDMFTVDRQRVVDICEYLIQSGEKFEWTTSARTDSVDEELLALMAKAGCLGLFFGVEAGSARMQKIIDKGLDIAEVKRNVDTAERLGLSTTVALITGFPEETEEDLAASVDMYMFGLRHPLCDPQFNVLAPLAETPVHSKYREQLVLEDLCSDMSHQGCIQNEADRDLIRRFPEIFPNFYMLPTPGLDRSCILELREFLLMGLVRIRWLLVALHERGTGILDVFLAWRKHREELHPEMKGGAMRRYYTRDVSRDEFLSFIAGRLTEFGSPAVCALFDYYQAYLKATGREHLVPPRGDLVTGPFAPEDVPHCKPGIFVFELETDIQEVIECLKRDEAATPRRERRLYRTSETPRGNIRVFQITPLLAQTLEECNGECTAGEVMTRLSSLFSGEPEFRRLAAECALEAVYSEGLIEIYRTASRADSSHDGAGDNCEYRSISATASPQNCRSIQAQ
jgi:Radical SAM superfamily